MAGCYLPFLLLVASCCLVVGEATAQTLPTQYPKVKTKDFAAARQTQQNSWQQKSQSSVDLIQAEQNDAQAPQPANQYQNAQPLNQQAYQPSYYGSNSQHQPAGNSNTQMANSRQGTQPANSQAQPPAKQNQVAPPSSPPSAPAHPANPHQVAPPAPPANPPRNSVPATGYPCDDLKSILCQESIDANITHGIAVLAQNLSVAVTQTTAGYQEPGNIVFSPVNLAAALALVLIGSDGETFAELAHVLGLAAGLNLRPEVREVMYEEFGRFLGQLERRQTVINSRQSVQGGNQVVFANGLFVQRDFCILERFDKIARYFRSEVHRSDFYRQPQQSKDDINAWFESQTRGRIKNMLVQAPPPDTRVLIASALYFNGEWEMPFPADVTAVRLFFMSMRVINGTYVDAYPVNMMTNSLDTRYHVDKDLGCRIVEIPYKGRSVSMFLILPDQPGVVALRDLERRLTPERLNAMIAAAKVVPTIVSMPRMKLSQTVSLRSALEALGVYTLFDPVKANLSLISEGKEPSVNGHCPKDGASRGSAPTTTTSAPTIPPPASAPMNPPTAWKQPSASRGSHPTFDPKQMLLTSRGNYMYVDRLYAADILHKVDVEVTETGTVAAAGTATTISRDGSNAVVRMNRPFLFLIRDNPTNLTMFYGSVVRPTPATQAEIDEAGPMATAGPPTRRPPFNSRPSRG